MERNEHEAKFRRVRGSSSPSRPKLALTSEPKTGTLGEAHRATPPGLRRPMLGPRVPPSARARRIRSTAAPPDHGIPLPAVRDVRRAKCIRSRATNRRSANWPVPCGMSRETYLPCSQIIRGLLGARTGSRENSEALATSNGSSHREGAWATASGSALRELGRADQARDLRRADNVIAG